MDQFTKKNIIETDEKYQVSAYQKYSAVLVKGEKSVAVGPDNEKYIDFTSGIGVNALGYSDPGWIAAVSAQLHKIQHTSNLYYNDTVALFADELCKAVKLNRAFLANSGAEANECAVKIARKYSFDKYGKGRNEIITLKNSFHGRTVTTLSATGQDTMHDFFFPFTEGFRYVTPGDIHDLKNSIDKKTCAVMLELIQGEGGVIPLNQEYVQEVQKICRENDLLLITDEIQTGAGRTGKFLAGDHYGISPDLVTLAKGLGGGLPIGACLCSEKTRDVIQNAHHGSTFGGNPVVSAGALYILSVVNNQAFLNEVAKKGEYFKGKLKKLPHVESVRGKGLMIGVTLQKGNAKEVAKRCVEKGLLILTAKEVVRLLPPLNIKYGEIDCGLNILETVLKDME